MAYFAEIQTIADIARFHARQRPDAVAMVFGDRVSSYAALDSHASRVANALIGEGVGPQQRIAFMDKNSDHYFEILFGAAKANAVLVGVNWRLAAPEVAYILDHSGSEVLFVGEEFVELVEKIAADLKTVKRIVVMGQAHGPWVSYEAWRDRAPDSDPMVPSGPQDVAIQMYTSGTTGHPKGVQLTNWNFEALRPKFEAEMPDWYRWKPEDVSLVAMPVFHIGGTGWALLGFYQGAKHVVVKDFVPALVLDLMLKHRTNRIFFVPAVILMMLQVPGVRQADFSFLDVIFYGASPIPLDLLRDAVTVFKCGFCQLYGMTESTGLGTYLPPEDHDLAGTPRMRSCGKALPGVEIRVVDASDQDVPAGQVGEILLRTPSIMKGYWNQPAETEKAMRGGWYHSGDAGYLDAEGYLYIHDRVKDMIVSGGENIYPAEIENALFGHPAIADVAVIGVPDERWGEAVKAVVVLKPGASLDAGDLIAWSRERIAGFKTPRSVDFVEALPRNPSGKLLKREIRAPFWAGRDRQVN